MNDFLVNSKALVAALLPLLFSGIAVLTGYVLIFKAGLKLARIGDPRSQQGDNFGAVGLQMLVAALLLQFSTTMESVSELVLGGGIEPYNGALAYVKISSGAGFAFWRTAMEVALLWVTFLGWIAAFRGFLKWSRAADGQQSSQGDPFWQGIWHILGGVCMINISRLARALFG